jgi:acyl carrier protein
LPKDRSAGVAVPGCNLAAIWRIRSLTASIGLPTNAKDRRAAGLFYISGLSWAFIVDEKKAKQSMSVRLRIIAAMQQIAEEQKVTLPPLRDDLSLHETGFDSLGFAILVARLEDDLGIDPFTMSEDVAFPLTVGDFIGAYENVPA